MWNDQDDLPKIVRDWRREQRRAEWPSLLFGLLCGLIGLGILLGGCALNLGVSGVRAGIEVDPGKLAPLMASPNRR